MGWNQYSVDGVGERLVTMKKNGTITKGTHEGFIAAVAANLEVKVAAAGEKIFGVIRNIAGDDITVQDKGYVTMPYSGATVPTVGSRNLLVADGNGGVTVDTTNGGPFFVVAVDTTNSKVTFDLG